MSEQKYNSTISKKNSFAQTLLFILIPSFLARFVRELKEVVGSRVAGMCCDIFCSNWPYIAGYAASQIKYRTQINITATFCFL